MSCIVEQPRSVCAFGAQQTVLGIKRAIPIVHAGPGCSSKMFEALSLNSGYQGEGYAGGSAIPSTNSSEQEIVFGGIAKLRSTIDGAVKVLDGDLFVVLTGCTADIVGDDVGQVVSEYRKKGVPIVNVETGGFRGSNYYGHELVLQAIIEQFIGDVTPNVKKGLVNVFSVLPFQNTYWRADLEAIKEILGKLGLTANVLFGYDTQGVAEWKTIPDAEFNLVLSPWVGLSTAKLLQNKYGTPYLHYPVLPVGAVETGNFIRAVGNFAALNTETIATQIKQEEARFYEYLLGAADFFTEFRSILPSKFYTIADSGYSLGISKFLVNELGFIPCEQFITDEPAESYVSLVQKEFNNLAEDSVTECIVENDGGKIHERIRKDCNKAGEVLLLGSSWEKELAEELKSGLVYISLPVNYQLVLHKTYVGYRGGLNLIEDIYAKVLGRQE